MTINTPKISVVIASHNARTSVEECLSALVAQRRDDELEIVVVDNSTDGTAELIRRRFCGIELIMQPQSALIPELWGVGIRRSRGEIVAITTAHFVPDKEWLSRILEAHEASAAAVGGVIENGSARVVDWAIFFCRYSPYMLPLHKTLVSEIAGDNASYKRRYIDQFRHVWSDGFWESAVHAELKKAGFQILLEPSIIVHYKRSFDVWSFIKQRFQHGRQFGKTRASHFSLPKRALYIFLSPVIPLMFLARITRQVVTKQRHRAKLLIAFPVLVVFLLAWSVGELVGYLTGP